MKNPKLHIPSLIAQSCFVDEDGEIVDLLRSEIDYFYGLLYLYREELLVQTPHLLLKDGGRYFLNEASSIGEVKIELNEFQQCGAVDNFKYGGVREFVDKLSELSVSINLLRKNSDREVETIKVVKSHSWDDTMLKIEFAKEFIKELIGVEKYFMEVDLSNLFNLSGGKSKSLYLILKDYSNIKNKNFTKDELILLIGRVPQTSVLDEIAEQINDKTDIKISYEVRGVKKKKYIFKINHKVNLKSASKGKSKTKKSINTDVMEKAKQQLQKMKDKGVKIDNEEGYLNTIYNKEMEKLTPSDDMKRIDKWLDDMKADYDGSDYGGDQIPIISIKNKITQLPIYIDDEYRLRDPFEVYGNTAAETLSKLNEWIESGEIGCDIWMMDGYSKPFEKVCLLSQKQLKQRGLVQ